MVRRDRIPYQSKEPDIRLDELSEQLPAKVDGKAGQGNMSETVTDIPVIFSERELSLHTCNWDGPFFDYKYRPVPGGCKVVGKSSYSGNWGAGTICTPVQHDGTGAQQLLTCGHLFGENGEGNEAQQPGGGEKIGTCAASVFRWEDKDSEDRDSDADRAFDCATIALDSGVDVDYSFASDNGSYMHKIIGRTGWDYIKDKGSIEKQGLTTGVQSGNVTIAYTNRTFETSAETESGDSGGPHYVEEWVSNGVSHRTIAGVHSYGPDDGCSYSGAIWAGKAENEFNVTI